MLLFPNLVFSLHHFVCKYLKMSLETALQAMDVSADNSDEEVFDLTTPDATPDNGSPPVRNPYPSE